MNGGVGGGGGGSETARERWRLLARALRRGGAAAADADAGVGVGVSVRRVASLGLLEVRRLEEDAADADAAWFEYAATVAHERYSVRVRRPAVAVTAERLMGFNDTGNVCVWPSEEVLAYCALRDARAGAFDGKSVLELGGGMTCLAGLLVAKYGRPARVRLTDGNAAAVDNVRRVAAANGLLGAGVSCAVLQWGDGDGDGGGGGDGDRDPADGRYDLVMAADCLFFDDGRSALAATMWAALADGGRALVAAPRRGRTLDEFRAEAVAAGFACATVERYDARVWRRHTQLKAADAAYDEDIHYPILLRLAKPFR